MLCVCAAWPSAASADDSRVEELARRLKDIQQQLDQLKAGKADKGAEVKAVQKSTAAQFADLHKKMDAQARVRMPNGRLTVVSAEGDFSLALRATVQFDAAYFSHDRTVEYRADRARPRQA